MLATFPLSVVSQPSWLATVDTPLAIFSPTTSAPSGPVCSGVWADSSGGSLITISCDGLQSPPRPSCRISTFSSFTQMPSSVSSRVLAAGEMLFELSQRRFLGRPARFFKCDLAMVNAVVQGALSRGTRSISFVCEAGIYDSLRIHLGHILELYRFEHDSVVKVGEVG